MSDENRPPIGWNTDDDNINFDISLDQNAALEQDNLNLFDEPKPKSDFEPNFDININPDDKPIQANKQTNTQEDSTKIFNTQEKSLDTNPIQQDIATNTDKIQDINIPSQIEMPNQINWGWDNLIQTDKDYNPDLKSVDDTIQQLQEAKEQWIKSISSEELSQIPTFNNPNVQINEPQDIQTEQQDNVWINLDEILPTPQAQSPETTIQTPPIQTTQTQEVVKVQFPESIQKSVDPYDLTKNTNETKIKNKSEHKKHLLMMVGIGSACLLVGFFILKTMYPVQFGSNDWDTQYVEITETTPPQEESNPFQQESLDNTGDIADEILDSNIDDQTNNSWQDTAEMITGDILPNDNETIQDNIDDTIPLDTNTDILTWDFQAQTGDTQDHNITDGTDPFEMLDNFQTDEEIKKQATLESLKDFQQKWQYYLDLEKQIRSSSMRKYWLYLEKKSEEFIKQIENWEILDISSLDTDLAQLSQFLQKLQDLENDSSQNVQQTGDQQSETQQ